MAKIYKNIGELIGNTPIVEAERFSKAVGAGSNILAKLEYFNPAGSVKDRVALSLIEDAEKSGVLKKGATIMARGELQDDEFDQLRATQVSVWRLSAYLRATR